MQSNDNNQPGKLAGRLTTGRAPGSSANRSSGLVLVPTVGPIGEHGLEGNSPLEILADQIDRMLADHAVGVLHRRRDSLAVYPWGEGFPIHISRSYLSPCLRPSSELTHTTDTASSRRPACASFAVVGRRGFR